jgi:hypothetical protein
MEVANVTATHSGELVEVNEDIGSTKFASLLFNGDEIVIHDVHNEEWMQDKKERYGDEWDEKVRFEVGDDGGDEDGEEETANADAVPATCRASGCDESPTMVAHCDTGQEKYFCDEHSGGRMAGIARAEEWVEL